MRLRLYIFTILFLLGPITESVAQTCCSGGVPVASNLGLPPAQAGAIQLSLSYDLNVLETLKTGTETLEDDSRSRKTHSTLLEVGYALSDKFSIDGLFSFVQQERVISQFSNRNISTTRGIGDAVFLLKYKIFSSDNTTIQIGLGPKVPLGASDKRNEQGLTLNADLQPGSGAWDLLSWAQVSHVLKGRPSRSIHLTAIHSFKGTNDSYLGSQIYQFGQEFQLAVGISDRLLLGNIILDPSLSLRYRYQAADILENFDLPSTGGQWVFINPSLSYWVNQDLSFEVAATLPLLSNIVGTQVTPTYRFRTGVFYRLFTKSKEDSTILPNITF